MKLVIYREQQFKIAELYYTNRSGFESFDDWLKPYGVTQLTYLYHDDHDDCIYEFLTPEHEMMFRLKFAEILS